MASTYTNTGIEIIGSGQQDSTWGDTTNTNWQMLDKATAQRAAVGITGAASTLTLNDGVLGDDARAAYLRFTGVLTANHTVTIAPDDLQKIYYVENATTSATDRFGVIIKQGTGDTVAVAPGAVAIVSLDGEGVGAAVKRLGSYSSGVSDKFYVAASEMYPFLEESPNGSFTNSYTFTGYTYPADEDRALNVSSPTAADNAAVLATLISDLEQVDGVQQLPNTVDTAPASGGKRRSINTWDFDHTSDDHVLFEKQMPNNWDGGELTFVPVWSVAATSAGGVAWNIRGLSLTAGTNLATDDWHHSSSYSVNVGATADIVEYGVQSETFTVDDAATAGSLVQFIVNRDVSHGSDTIAAEVRLHGLFIYYNSAEACVC